MGLLTKIEEIREKPEPARERVVFVATAGIMIVLFLFWMFDFSMNAGSPALPGTATSTPPSPFTILGNNFGALIQQAKDQFNK